MACIYVRRDKQRNMILILLENIVLTKIRKGNERFGANTSGAIQYGLPLNEKGHCCPLI
jgi:hypothetical protein